jgi:hypothetical protein
MAWEATNWVVDDAQATGSDHEVIRFEVTMTIPNPTIATPQSRLNWSRTDWDSFSDTLHSLSTSTQSQWECLRLDPTPPHLDKWAETLWDIIMTAAEYPIPPLDPSPRSKHWWTPEVSAARHNMQHGRTKNRRGREEEMEDNPARWPPSKQGSGNRRRKMEHTQG